MQNEEMLKKIREEISALRQALLDQEPPLYSGSEILKSIGYAKSNRTFIPYAEQQGWLKPVVTMGNGSKRYPRKQVRALRRMLAEGKTTICI